MDWDYNLALKMISHLMLYLKIICQLWFSSLDFVIPKFHLVGEITRDQVIFWCKIRGNVLKRVNHKSQKGNDWVSSTDLQNRSFLQYIGDEMTQQLNQLITEITKIWITVNLTTSTLNNQYCSWCLTNFPIYAQYRNCSY